ncbi:uncharacterized protein [Cicer arietinum]|uniref:Calmodulin binding protein PICBP-like n=1 Tax=Cicer arietinum TaxID=3827 RepID=A0A1S2Y7I3_CICAR|nr:calmodulin binding protein PICBP-like [Cicer arietinum]
MVQRKVQNKFSIQVEHVKSQKHSSNMKLSSSSQNQDGKIKGYDHVKKKMKKSKSIKISDLDQTLQSTPQKKNPTTPNFSPNGSPNYMKPTSSSHAKKDLFHVSLKRTQSCSDLKSLPRKFSSDSKVTCVSSSSSSQKPSKALTKTSSLSLVRTLTKTTSFKAFRTSCPRKSSTRVTICGDMNAKKPNRATCSSTLKDSKFPSYLMLNHGGSELEGTSIMKVCSYTYCSLNGHHHDDLPPLKTFVSSRRRLLKAQKRVKVEALSPRSRRLKGHGENEKKDYDFEKNVFDAKDAHDEIGVDFFIEIYDNEKDANLKGEDEMEKNEFLIEDIIKSTIEDDLEGDLEKSFEAEDQQTSWSHEEMSMGSYCNDEEKMEDVDNDDMQLEEENFHGFVDHKNDVDSDFYADEENDSKSESSHDMSVTWLDDILSSYYEDIILVDETIKEAKFEENIYLEEQLDDGVSSVLEDKIGSNEAQEIGYLSDEVGCDDRSSMADQIFDYTTNAEENGIENIKKELDEDTKENNQCEKMIETCNVDETSQEKKEEKKVLEKDKAKGSNKRTSCIVNEEEENTRDNWKGVIRRKRCVENDDDDEMRKFNPKEPNFLPLVDEQEQEKVDLRHQMMDERKNAEDWMVDCALRQVVNKLGPAKKKKVALLVEAFETVIPKCESHLRNNSGFAHARHIQTCS